MTSRARILSVAAVLLALSAIAPGCTRQVTAPPPPARLHRTVTLTLLDSLGVRYADQQVALVGLLDSAGSVPVLFERTDTNGDAVFVLGEGTWTATVEPMTVAPPPARRLVAGTTFVVAGASRPAADTVWVRLVFATASRVTGTAVLAGQADSQGIVISAGPLLYPIATSNASGAWTLEDMPPGSWNLTLFRAGHALVTRPVVVPAPGSTVALPPVQLN